MSGQQCLINRVNIISLRTFMSLFHYNYVLLTTNDRDNNRKNSF